MLEDFICLSMSNPPKGGRRKNVRRGCGGVEGLSILSDTHFEVNILRGLKTCLFNMHCYHGGRNRMCLLSYFLIQLPWIDFSFQYSPHLNMFYCSEVQMEGRMYLNLIKVKKMTHMQLSVQNFKPQMAHLLCWHLAHNSIMQLQT